jgi:hypothetical protein
MTIILNGTTGVTFPNGVTMSDGTSAPVTVAQGGTGQITRQAAMDALAGAVTSGRYLRGDGTDVIMDTLKAADMTGTVAIANGGTGSTTLTANNVLLGNGTSALQVVAPGTAGNLLTSNGTTWTSAAAPAGGVTSLNGQTGAITNTGLDNIGSYCASYYAVTTPASGITNINGGATVAGSTLRYNATRQIGGTSGFNNSFTTLTITGNAQSYPYGGTAFTGTWRCVSGASTGVYVSGCDSFSTWAPGLFVRIS